MTRYLAIPKQNTALSTLGLSDIGFGRGSRRRQIARLREFRRQEERALRRSRTARTALTRLKAENLSLPSRQTPITGITMFDAGEEAAAEMRAAMPDHDIIADMPFTLVPPSRAGEAVADAAAVDTWHLEAIQLLRARRAGFRGTGRGVGVAILDTGIEEVPEIDGRVNGAFLVDSRQSRLVPVDTRDTHGHGTHVAGLVAGRHVGVAPEASLLNVIMIPGGNGMLSDFVLSIEFVARRPEISIMNMSAGIVGYDPGMHVVMQSLLLVGVLPVVAIGNEGADTSRSPGNYTEVLSVGASTRHDRVAGFSGGGTMVVNHQSYPIPDLVAPGQDVTSCVMTGGYEAWNGTSMATPIVSGLAALIIEDNPGIEEPDLRAELIEAARALPSFPVTRQGAGLAQLPRALW